MPTYTSHYAFGKPIVGEATWTNTINSTIDAIDSALVSATSSSNSLAGLPQSSIRGPWVSGTTYNLSDVVIGSNGNIYLAEIANLTTDPTIATTGWEQILGPGLKGDKGDTGSVNSPITVPVTFQQPITSQSSLQIGSGTVINEFPDDGTGRTWVRANSSTGLPWMEEYNDGSFKFYCLVSLLGGLALSGSLNVPSLTLPDGTIVGLVNNPGGLNGLWSVLFSNGDIASYIDPQGSFRAYYEAFFQAGVTGPCSSGTCVDSDGWSYTVARDSAGFFQIWKTRGTKINQLTDDASNSWSPVLLSGEDSLAFTSDRKISPTSSYSVQAYRMTVGGCNQVPLSLDLDNALRGSMLNYIIGLGQSLRGGAASGSPVTTLPYGHTWMLNGGPMELGSYTLVANPSTLVSCIEVDASGSGDETPTSSSLQQLASLCIRYKGFSPQLAGQSAAKGGTDLNGLSLGSDAFNWAVNQATTTKNIASTQLLLPTLIAGIGLTHGETNSQENSTLITYGEAFFTNLYNPLCVSLAKVFGYDSKPPVYVMQQASEISYASHTQATFAAMISTWIRLYPGRLFFTGPEYCQQKSYDTQSVHLLALGYQWLGQLEGAAMFRQRVLRQKFTGLLPILGASVKSGNTIYVPFNVPKPIGSNAPPTLVIDTTSMPQPSVSGGMYGFEVQSSSNSIVPINSVTIVNDVQGNPTVIKIVCTSDPGPGGNVGYGYTYGGVAGGNPVGTWGNLRDNDTCPALYPTIQGPYLWNWCGCFFDPYSS